MQRGLYQSKVTPSLTDIQGPGLLAHNCKMAYYPDTGRLKSSVFLLIRLVLNTI